MKQYDPDKQSTHLLRRPDEAVPLERLLARARRQRALFLARATRRLMVRLTAVYRGSQTKHLLPRTAA